jgi:hypothetical protein
MLAGEVGWIYLTIFARRGARRRASLRARWLTTVDFVDGPCLIRFIRFAAASRHRSLPPVRPNTARAPGDCRPAYRIPPTSEPARYITDAATAHLLYSDVLVYSAGCIGQPRVTATDPDRILEIGRSAAPPRTHVAGR